MTTSLSSASATAYPRPPAPDDDEQDTYLRQGDTLDQVAPRPASAWGTMGVGMSWFFGGPVLGAVGWMGGDALSEGLKLASGGVGRNLLRGTGAVVGLGLAFAGAAALAHHRQPQIDAKEQRRFDGQRASTDADVVAKDLVTLFGGGTSVDVSRSSHVSSFATELDWDQRWLETSNEDDVERANAVLEKDLATSTSFGIDAVDGSRLFNRADAVGDQDGEASVSEVAAVLKGSDIDEDGDGVLSLTDKDRLLASYPFRPGSVTY
jgi:hypothetical protein